VAVDVAMEDGDVAITYNPFGMLAKAREVEAVDDADGAVAATCAEDGMDGGVVELLLKGTGTGGVVASKLVVDVVKVVRKHHFELPRAEQADGSGDFSRGYFACRGDDGDTVAGL